jgi:hypothetical protein
MLGRVSAKFEGLHQTSGEVECPSADRLEEELENPVVHISRECYADLGPPLVAEKLAEGIRSCFQGGGAEHSDRGIPECAAPPLPGI